MAMVVAVGIVLGVAVLVGVRGGHIDAAAGRVAGLNGGGAGVAVGVRGVVVVVGVGVVLRGGRIGDDRRALKDAEIEAERVVGGQEGGRDQDDPKRPAEPLAQGRMAGEVDDF